MSKTEKQNSARLEIHKLMDELDAECASKLTPEYYEKMVKGLKKLYPTLGKKKFSQLTRSNEFKTSKEDWVHPDRRTKLLELLTGHKVKKIKDEDKISAAAPPCDDEKKKARSERLSKFLMESDDEDEEEEEEEEPTGKQVIVQQQQRRLTLPPYQPKTTVEKLRAFRQMAKGSSQAAPQKRVQLAHETLADLLKTFNTKCINP
jgi:hypothetical protein